MFDVCLIDFNNHIFFLDFRSTFVLCVRRWFDVFDICLTEASNDVVMKFLVVIPNC